MNAHMLTPDAIDPFITAALSDTKDQVERALGISKKKDPPATTLEWLSQQLTDLRESSTTKQVIVGTASGYVSGIVCGKFGRIAATAVGGSVICLHLAQKYGYITVNWKRVNGDLDRAKKELEKKAQTDGPAIVAELHDLVVENVLLASGFGGGFLLGLASS